MKKNMLGFKTFCFVLLSLCLCGATFYIFKMPNTTLVSTSATAGLGLTAEKQGSTLHIDVKTQEETLQALTQTAGVTFASAADVSLPTDVNTLTVDFMRQFQAVASQITTITLSDKICVLGDAFFSEDEQRYIGVFDGFTALKSVSMPSVDTIGSYAFYGCTSLTTLTTNVEMLTVNNLSVRTSGALQVQAANLKEVVFNGTWGTVVSGGASSSITGGFTQEDMRIFPYAQIENIIFNDRVNISENVFTNCTNLQMVQAMSAVAFDLSSLDANLTQQFKVALTSVSQLTGTPTNGENVNIDNVTPETAAQVDNIFTCLLFQVTQNDNDAQYFTFAENTYASYAEGAPYLYHVQNNGTGFLCADYLYLKTLASGALSDGTFIKYLQPANSFGQVREDVSILYIPYTILGKTFDYIDTDFEEGAKNPVSGVLEGEGLYQNITTLVLSGEWQKAGYLYEGGMPTLQTIIFCDGVVDVGGSVTDMAAGEATSSLESIWLPNTLQLTNFADSYLGVGDEYGLAFMIGTDVRFYMHEGGTASNVIKISEDKSYITNPSETVLYFANVNGYIPETIETIGPAAFVYKTNLPEMVIGGNVKNIQFQAFAYASSTSGDNTLCIEDSVTSISPYAFGATQFTKVVLGAGITVIPKSCFSSAENLQTVEMRGLVTRIEETAFQYAGVTQITIPSTVQYIGEYCFSFSALQQITIPNTVQFIGRNCFEYSPLESVVFEENSQLTTLERSIFRYCSNLVMVDFGDNSQLSALPDYAFDYDYALEYIDFGANSKIVEIPNGTFSNLRALQNVDFGENSSLQSIGGWAFRNCSALTKITIPEGVTSIGENAFNGCTGLQTIINYSTVNTVAGSTTNGYVAYYATQVFFITKATMSLTAFSGSAAEVQIPEGVLSIGVAAFIEIDTINSITIPASVTAIYERAFYECAGLQLVTFAENSQMQSIDFLAFSRCISLTDITLPLTLTSIGASAFSACANLQTVTFAENSELTIIEDAAFTSCTSLTSITIPASVTEIGAGAFINCNSLQEVFFAEGSILLAINNSLFKDCIALTNISIPESVTSIGDSAFQNCSALTDFQIPESVTSIGDSAFDSCSALTDVYLPAGLTNIMQFAFNGCASLQTVVFAPGSALQKIDSYAFQNCGALTDITVPASITNIAEYAFYNCMNLNSVLNYSSLTLTAGETTNGYVAYYATQIFTAEESTQILTAFSGTETNITIPEGIQILGDNIFRQNTSILQVTIPASVTNINQNAFSMCTNLQEVIFAEESNLQTIGKSAFYRCESLTNISWPDTLTEIEDGAFQRCYNLKEVLFSENAKLKKISYDAFRECTSLEKIVLPPLLNFIAGYAFESCENLRFVINLSQISITPGESSITYAGYYANYVGDGSDLELIDGVHWVNTTTQTYLKYIGQDTHVVLPDGIRRIGRLAFYKDANLQNITIPDSVVNIGDEAFYKCSALTSIVIPSGVTKIDKYTFFTCDQLQTVTFAEESQLQSIETYAFYSCKALISIAIPAGVMNIGDYTFNGCTNLQTVAFAENAVLRTIGNNAFSGCSVLTNVTLPSNITSIGNYAFSSCTSLTSIIIPSRVTSIGNYAFNYCTSLQTVTFAEGSQLKSIGGAAFRSCSSLTSIVIPSYVKNIGNYAFQYCTNLQTVTFKNAYGWFVTTSSSATSGTSVTLTDPAQNATYLKTTYVRYYWKK